MSKPLVGIVMGSKSDLDIMQGAAKVLDEFGISYEIRVLSAHRTPKEAANYIETARQRGLKVIIAGAGGSAHLAGVASAHTELPVLAIPVKRDGHDHEALFSNVMMPPGIPLATMPENGGKNTGLFAVEILALGDSELLKKYQDFRKTQHDKVLSDDQSIQ
ncbi:MAG: 5-(carboxyamino)imidazole ribonucleotide mutase [Candidatus Saccharimonadales bacterium]